MPPAKCTPQTTARYANRASPPYPANACCGQTREGNDGRMYKSVADKTGRCRWVLHAAAGRTGQGKKGAKTVVINCQGNYGMVVHLVENEKKAVVFVSEAGEDENENVSDVLVQHAVVPYQDAVLGYDTVLSRDWLGREKPQKRAVANGVVLRTSPGNYVLIADDRVMAFKTIGNGPATSFTNKVGHSGVTLPIVETAKHLYKLDSSTFEAIAVVEKTPELLRELERLKSLDTKEEEMPALYHLADQRPDIERAVETRMIFQAP